MAGVLHFYSTRKKTSLHFQFGLDKIFHQAKSKREFTTKQDFAARVRKSKSGEKIFEPQEKKLSFQKKCFFASTSLGKGPRL